MAQAYKAAVEQKREAKAKAAEEKKAVKVAKKDEEKGGAPANASIPELDKKVAHFCPSTGSFLSDLLGSCCDIRPIHEISNLRSLKQAYHELGEVDHSITQ